ncbi:hypothetical protein [Aurantimonas sp. Leaf443]|uniref:hypothetical protein n=1 Tax=Aurantimonas sp. Leaf443 TaxID=1736378 RepID=UPI000B2EC346|nr:hypothetical protein [Aurantimonas sp. Leaf443]
MRRSANLHPAILPACLAAAIGAGGAFAVYGWASHGEALFRALAASPLAWCL